jgi:hypothetical protein
MPSCVGFAESVCSVEASSEDVDSPVKDDVVFSHFLASEKVIAGWRETRVTGGPEPFSEGGLTVAREKAGSHRQGAAVSLPPSRLPGDGHLPQIQGVAHTETRY